MFPDTSPPAFQTFPHTCRPYPAALHDFPSLLSLHQVIHLFSFINKITEVEISHSASDFRTLRRNVVETIKELPERCRFSKGIFAWVGYNTYLMPYVVDKRASGESKWSFGQLLSYAMDGIIAFSTKPLTISIVLGIIMFLFSILLFIYILIRQFVFLSIVHSFIILTAIILFVSGSTCGWN